jgi:hypothetical protein
LSTAATAAIELLPDGMLVLCDGEVGLADRALSRLTGEEPTGRPAPDRLPAAGGSGEVDHVAHAPRRAHADPPRPHLGART